jgi:hypothetical protein
MAMAYWLALQAASAPAPIDFDLASLSRPRYALSDQIAARQCDRGNGSAIVVCGRREAGAYPLAEWARIFPPEGPLRAEGALGGGAVGRVFGQSEALDRGVASNRLMIGITIPF